MINTENSDQTYLTNVQPACTSEQELIERYIGIAFDKQVDFGEIIGSNDWNVNMTDETISFGPGLTFKIQVLGTFSHGAQNWLWSWANTMSGLSENIVKQALELKKYGETYGIDLLSRDSFDFSKDQLYVIGAIASGKFDTSGFYIADYGQGAMVVTIKDPKIDDIKKEDQARILSVFTQVISEYPMNHRNAYKSYLLAKGYIVTESENKVTGIKNDNSISAQFDELDRVVVLNG